VNTNAFLLYYLHLWDSGTVLLRRVNTEQYGSPLGKGFPQFHPLTLAKKTEGASESIYLAKFGTQSAEK